MKLRALHVTDVTIDRAKVTERTIAVTTDQDDLNLLDRGSISEAEQTSLTGVGQTLDLGLANKVLTTLDNTPEAVPAGHDIRRIRTTIDNGISVRNYSIAAATVSDNASFTARVLFCQGGQMLGALCADLARDAAAGKVPARVVEGVIDDHKSRIRDNDKDSQRRTGRAVADAVQNLDDLGAKYSHAMATIQQQGEVISNLTQQLTLLQARLGQQSTSPAPSGNRQTPR